ncbi:MAG: hypothetical protein JWN07_393 [Hyphomicrobiales bacterium]|nr:hypothetical protein [Hyphomicrobiales bacterium]
MILGAIDRPRASAPAVSNVATAVMTVAMVAVDKLTEIVMEETRVLRERGDADLERFTHQKNHGLLEVTRAMRGVPAEAVHPSLVTRLRFLRDRLEENRKVLGLHLKAATEIADLVSGTLEEAASDGTYTASAFRGRMK